METAVAAAAATAAAVGVVKWTNKWKTYFGWTECQRDHVFPERAPIDFDAPAADATGNDAARKRKGGGGRRGSSKRAKQSSKAGTRRSSRAAAAKTAGEPSKQAFVPDPIVTVHFDKPYPLPDYAEEKKMFEAVGLGGITGDGSDWLIYEMMANDRFWAMFYDWPENIADELEELRDNGVFMEERGGNKHSGKNFISGSPKWRCYTRRKVTAHSPSLNRYIQFIQNTFSAKLEREALRSYSCGGVGEGKMEFHGDGLVHDLRSLSSIGGKASDDPDIKTMTFKHLPTGETATIRLRHGAVIVIDRVAAGAVPCHDLEHAVHGAQGTWLHIMDLWIPRPE